MRAGKKDEVSLCERMFCAPTEACWEQDLGLQKYILLFVFFNDDSHYTTYTIIIFIGLQKVEYMKK